MICHLDEGTVSVHSREGGAIVVIGLGGGVELRLSVTATNAPHDERIVDMQMRPPRTDDWQRISWAYVNVITGDAHQ